MKPIKTTVTMLAVIACTSAALLSCTQEIPDTYVKGQEQAIAFQPTTSISTKAPVTGTAFPDRAMVVSSHYYATGGGTSATFFQGVSFTKSGSVWAADKYWPLAGELDFLAFSAPSLNPTYVYGGTKITDEVTITIGTNATTQEDILYGYAAQTARVTSVPMTFKHAQAMITFKAKSNVAYDSSTNVGITITKITLNDAKYSGACRMLNNGTCTWSNLGSAGAKDVPSLSSTNLTTSYSAQLGTGIMVPEQACTTATITYTLHNGKQGGVNHDNPNLVKTVTLTSPDTSWLEGKNYCYNLNITQYGITITPTVTDWVAGSPDAVAIP